LRGMDNLDGIEVPKDWVPIISWPQFFYAQQKEYINSEKWQTWFIGGNGTGKTHMVFWSVAALVLGIHPKQIAPPPLRVCVIEPDYDKVLDVALEKLQSPQVVMPHNIELGAMLPPSMVTKGYNKDHRSIDLRNGSQIIFVTNEQGWKAMRGKQFDALAVDEECDQRVFDENLRGLRNAKGGGRVIAGLTPPYEEGQGPTWTKDRIVDNALGDTDIHVVNACMADNPAITSEFIERFSRGKTQKQIDVQVYGRYPTWGDLVHPDFQDSLWSYEKCHGHLLRNDTPMPEAYEVDWVMAFDWHPSKPCAALWGWVSRDGNITIFDELDKEVARDKDISELTDIFKNVEGDPFYKRRFSRWQDPSAKQLYKAQERGFNAWDEFRRCGIVTSAARNRDPLVGISIVNDYFKGNGRDTPRLFIYERCKFLRQYLRNHYWKRGEDGVGKPDPKWSDYPVCLKYILQEVGLKRQKNRRNNKWPTVSYGRPEVRRPTIDLGRYF